MRVLLSLLVLLALPVVAQAQDTTPDPPALDADALARRLHEAVNQARAAAGLPVLAWRGDLHRLARVHSRDMARRDFFAHTNPDGEGVNDRAARLGVPCERPAQDDGTRLVGLAENLAQSARYVSYQDRFVDGERVGRTYAWRTAGALVRATLDGWLGSPGHRATLLHDAYHAHGLGVAFTDTHAYVTHVFC
jgi:uncharacterized protein YkwD